MALKVIGVGWGRTGTDSMREALNMLGFGPCHHMYEINANPVLRDLWRALAKGAAPDWERLFEGFNACVDWPAAHYWRELIAAYPDAPVILTARPAEDWWTSFSTAILPFLERAADPEMLGITLVANQALQGRPGDRDHVIALYNAHVAEVLATVPRDRLLVHALGDGWEPLCAHLGVPVPQVPYPRRNSAQEMQAQFARTADT